MYAVLLLSQAAAASDWFAAAASDWFEDARVPGFAWWSSLHPTLTRVHETGSRGSPCRPARTLCRMCYLWEVRACEQVSWIIGVNASTPVPACMETMRPVPPGWFTPADDRASTTTVSLTLNAKPF
jgi:hypothetical protein